MRQWLIHRERLPTAIIGYAVVAALLLLAATRADRYAVSVTFAVPMAILPPLGAGLLGRSWRLMLLVPVPFVLGFLLAFVSATPLAPILAGILLAVAAIVGFPAGIGLGRRVAMLQRPAVGVVVLAAGLLVVPVAIIDARRTVTVERVRPLAIDERAGTFRGAGLGDSLDAVRARLGRGERVLPDDPRSRGVGPDVITGPIYLDATGDELRYGRDLSFLLDDNRRVEAVEVADRRAQTRAGVGPGDSLSRFRAAYPDLRCTEGCQGSDVPIPYPSCSVRLAERRWLYVGGTYNRRGRPAVVLILSRRRVGP